jgi:hypothetical protein
MTRTEDKEANLKPELKRKINIQLNKYMNMIFILVV